AVRTKHRGLHFFLMLEGRGELPAGFGFPNDGGKILAGRDDPATVRTKRGGANSIPVPQLSTHRPAVRGAPDLGGTFGKAFIGATSHQPGTVRTELNMLEREGMG